MRRALFDSLSANVNMKILCFSGGLAIKLKTGFVSMVMGRWAFGIHVSLVIIGRVGKKARDGSLTEFSGSGQKSCGRVVS